MPLVMRRDRLSKRFVEEKKYVSFYKSFNYILYIKHYFNGLSLMKTAHCLGCTATGRRKGILDSI